MNFLPGSDSIVEELLLVCSLAQCGLVAQKNFTVLPFLDELIKDRSSQALIEHLLSAAIKLRVLDDKTELLKRGDRKHIAIGQYHDDGAEKPEEVCIRLAINKLLHHESIAVRVEDVNSIVVGRHSAAVHEEKLIPTGIHRSQLAIIDVQGHYRLRRWQLEIDLYTLINECLRALA